MKPIIADKLNKLYELATYYIEYKDYIFDNTIKYSYDYLSSETVGDVIDVIKNHKHIDNAKCKDEIIETFNKINTIHRDNDNTIYLEYPYISNIDQLLSAIDYLKWYQCIELFDLKYNNLNNNNLDIEINDMNIIHTLMSNISENNVINELI